jgi:hypothetical protein
MPRKSRGPEIIEAIRTYLVGAVKRPEPITDERLMEVAECARATFYRYVTKDSDIEGEIETARREQEENVVVGDGDVEELKDLRKRLSVAEEGARNLTAMIVRMTDNLTRRGIPLKVILAAQREALSHPNRNFSHAGKGHQSK